MHDWTAGYVTDTEYTFGHYIELNPLRTRLALLNQGLAPPRIQHACELGFGQGVSINLHAAASSTRWSGTDFNPSQVVGARDLAAAAGSDVLLSDDAFEDFAQREDLPGFDFISLHGIWSWVSDSNRHALVDFIARHLNPGGVLYISYNTQPGWAAFAPMRHLMAEHARIAGARSNIDDRAGAAVKFAESVLNTNPLYARANPNVAERLGKLKDQNPRYLAHEYFNQHWDPMHFSTVAEWLAPARLDYATSATLLDSVDALHLKPEQQKFLAELPDPIFRESVRDFMVNQQFRRDYWVRGARRLNALERAEALRAERVILATHREDADLKVKGALGEASMNREVYEPVLDYLADHQPRSITDIEQATRSAGVTFAQLLQAVVVLSGKGHLHPVQSDSAIKAANARTDALNRHLLNRARGSDDITFLASPVTGGGIRVSRFQQLFLMALTHGHQQPEDWSRFAWELLAAQGQRLVTEGRKLETSEENLAELIRQAREFAEKRLTALRAMKVVI